MRRRLDIGFLALALALTACSGAAGLGGRDGGSSGGAETSAKPDQPSPTKPSDRPEGVPGYLTGEAPVTARAHDDGVTLEAGPGAVAAQDGASGAVLLQVWKVPSDAYAAAISGGKKATVTLPTAVLLAAVLAGADGSVTVELPGVTLGDFVLVLDASGRDGELVAGAVEAGPTSAALGKDAAFAPIPVLKPGRQTADVTVVDVKGQGVGCNVALSLEDGTLIVDGLVSLIAKAGERYRITYEEKAGEAKCGATVVANVLSSQKI